MKITPDQCFECLGTIFKPLNWDVEYKNKPKAILGGFQIDQTHNAQIAIAMDDERDSVIFGSTYLFQPPKSLCNKIRHFLIEEAVILYGTNIQFNPKEGVHINNRCWLPDLPLNSEELRALMEPYLKAILRTANYLFPRLIEFLNKQEVLRRGDNFHLPN